MEALTDRERLLMHPYVIAELRMGNLKRRKAFLSSLHQMDMATRASDEEVSTLVESHHLFGSGIGWIDAHLLTSVLLMGEARLWTRDRRLNSAAQRLGVAFQPHH
ncbi:Ribonuclease VapC32 [Brevundimonas sp. NIBR10]|nr:Ribonuclease VapC32 [Brevundimonas sp. NIBR10]